MKRYRYAFASVLLLVIIWSGLLRGQQPATAPPGAVPQLVNFSGKATDTKGDPVTGVAGITFSIYQNQDGGAPLWMETQNVVADARGNYSVQLGATTSDGLPLELFSTGEARWLGVRVNGGEEQPRVLLLSVPYALKAADAQTLGGLPASAFMLAGPSAAANNPGAPLANPADANTPGNIPPPSSSDVTTTGGTVNAVPLFTTATNVQSSILTQAGTTAINVGGKLNLPAAGAATASKGFSSRPLDFVASSFNSGTAAPVAQTFQWQAEPANNNTANPSAVLSLLYGSGTTAPADTGLRIGPKGIIGFAPGQTFPGTGPGTITDVKAGTALTGGGTSGSVTLNLDTTKVPLLAASNTFTGNQTVNGNLSATGTLAGSSFQIGSNLFAFGSYNNASAYLGFAGNTASTGLNNTGIGEYALAFDTYGATNTAIGSLALYQNTIGYSNTATGANALYANTQGTNNTADGFGALQSNTTTSNNTAIGYGALQSTMTCCNTAVGYGALEAGVAGPNDAFGYQALTNNSGFANAAFGYQALYSNVNGSTNSAFGYQALYSDTTNYYFVNDAFGYQALYSNTTGGGNDAFGIQALYSNTTGGGNYAFGQYALYSNTTGGTNVAFGGDALYSNTTGILNTAVGDSALGSNIGGYQNTAVGQDALLDSTGNFNTGVGSGALHLVTTGSSLTCIGAECEASGNITNATAIGAHSLVEQSNSLVLGGTGAYAVKVGIGTTTPSNILTVAQGAGHPVSDSWETYSSRRWKTNIQTLPDALAKVQQMRGVSYNLKNSGKHEIGVIAEEVGAVVPELVTYEDNGKDARSVDYSRLTALLIEAVKQEQREIQRQELLVRRQAAAIRDLRSELQETRQSLKKIKTQSGAAQPTLEAQKMLTTIPVR